MISINRDDGSFRAVDDETRQAVSCANRECKSVIQPNRLPFGSQIKKDMPAWPGSLYNIAGSARGPALPGKPQGVQKSQYMGGNTRYVPRTLSQSRSTRSTAGEGPLMIATRESMALRKGTVAPLSNPIPDEPATSANAPQDVALGKSGSVEQHELMDKRANVTERHAEVKDGMPNRPKNDNVATKMKSLSAPRSADLPPKPVFGPKMPAKPAPRSVDLPPKPDFGSRMPAHPTKFHYAISKPESTATLPPKPEFADIYNRAKACGKNDSSRAMSPSAECREEAASVSESDSANDAAVAALQSLAALYSDSENPLVRAQIRRLRARGRRP